MLESAVCKRYGIEPYRSTLRFEGKSSLHPIAGQATNLSGFVEVTFAQDGSLVFEPTPSMHLEFPVERLSAGNRMQDETMWQMIGSRRNPTVSADLRDLRATAGPGRYAAEGDLTLAGATQRYTGELTVARDGAAVTIDGTLGLDIRDFGLRPPQLFFLKVDPHMKISLHLVAVTKA